MLRSASWISPPPFGSTVERGLARLCDLASLPRRPSSLLSNTSNIGAVPTSLSDTSRCICRSRHIHTINNASVSGRRAPRGIARGDEATAQSPASENSGRMIVLASPTWAHLGSLPPDTKKVDIIKALVAAGPTGRVMAMTLTPPHEGRYREYAQASIEFDSVAGARRLYHLNKENKFLVKGVRPFIKLQTKKGNGDPVPATGSGGETWDSSKAKAQPQSRVILLKGAIDDPRLIVSSIRWLLKEQGVPLETESIEVKDYTARGARLIVWRFCSWRYQARIALRVLREQIGCQLGRYHSVGVFYGHDPCEGERAEKLSYSEDNSPQDRS